MKTSSIQEPPKVRSKITATFFADGTYKVQLQGEVYPVDLQIAHNATRKEYFGPYTLNRHSGEVLNQPQRIKEETRIRAEAEEKARKQQELLESAKQKQLQKELEQKQVTAWETEFTNICEEASRLKKTAPVWEDFLAKKQAEQKEEQEKEIKIGE